MKYLRYQGYLYRQAVALPDVLYHGTTQEFRRFDPSRIGRRDSGNLGTGVYLTDDPHFAMRYAEDNAQRFGGEPVVLEVHHRIRNVANYPDHMKDIKAEFGSSSAAYQDREFSDQLRDWFLDRGYDASMMGSEIVVYRPDLLTIVGRADVMSTDEHMRHLYRTKMQELGLEP